MRGGKEGGKQEKASGDIAKAGVEQVYAREH